MRLGVRTPRPTVPSPDLCLARTLETSVQARPAHLVRCLVRYRQAVVHEPASSIGSVNGSRILLVEDDEDIGSELIQALTSHGYRARLAIGGTEALSAATAEPPDLGLLDLGLPDIDGVVRCRRPPAAVPAGTLGRPTARTSAVA